MVELYPVSRDIYLQLCGTKLFTYIYSIEQQGRWRFCEIKTRADVSNSERFVVVCDCL